MKNVLVLLCICVIVLHTSALPSGSYSNVRLQKSKANESPPWVGSNVPVTLLNDPSLANKPPSADNIFEKPMDNVKNAPQDDKKVLEKRIARNSNWNRKINVIDELKNSKDIEKGVLENIDLINQQYDDLPSESGKLEHEFDDDNTANDKFDYNNKFNGTVDDDVNNINGTEDDV